jgi:hypothetical protein
VVADSENKNSNLSRNCIVQNEGQSMKRESWYTFTMHRSTTVREFETTGLQCMEHPLMLRMGRHVIPLFLGRPNTIGQANFDSFDDLSLAVETRLDHLPGDLVEIVFRPGTR